MSDYGITRTLPGKSLDDALAVVTEALKTEGFGILTRIDVQATLKEKIGVAVEPYLILGACNPALAHRAISLDPRVGLLLPCNVVVRAVQGGTEVQIADPRAMFVIADEPRLAPVVDEAAARLDRVAARLAR